MSREHPVACFRRSEWRFVCESLLTRRRVREPRASSASFWAAPAVSSPLSDVRQSSGISGSRPVCHISVSQLLRFMVFLTLIPC